MAIASKKEFFEFLRTSKKFCKEIDNYSSTLGLSRPEVEQYKNDNRFLAQLNSPERLDDAWDERQIHNKIENLHVALAHLTQVCKNSKNYSPEIGAALGIEVGQVPMRAGSR